MESYFRVSADAADTDKRLRREYMRFVWRKRRAYLPGFVFSLVILFVIAPVSAFLAAGRGGYELLFVGIACLCICCFSRISPPRCSVAAGERPARSTISRRIPSSCTAAEAKKKRRRIPISRRSSSFPACLFFLRAEKGRRPFQRKLLFRGEAEAFAAFISVRCGREITAFPTDAGGAPFSQSARSFLPR